MRLTGKVQRDLSGVLEKFCILIGCTFFLFKVLLNYILKSVHFFAWLNSKSKTK